MIIGNKEMDRSLRDILKNFREQLGGVSPYLALIDIASNELIKYDKNKISGLAKKNGHKNLVVHHLELKKIPLFVHLSHLAFIHSKSENFCDDFRDYQKKYYDDKSSPNLDGLDKLRKYIFYLHVQKTGVEIERADGFDPNIYEDYVGGIELKIVDYYRKIRNTQFHGGVLVLDNHDLGIFSHAENKQIKSKYNYIPQKVNELTFRDVILYSTVWQEIAVQLCKKLVNIELIVKKLCIKYKGKTSQRRDNAISNTLRRVYLQDDNDIKRLKQLTNDWLA